MSMGSLNPIQKSALEAAGNVALSAGAGAGKTRVLVERYVELFLREPTLGIDNVVAITFTNKAAAEMKSRIRARLIELLETERDLQRFDRLYTLKENIASAYISTIHALCGRVLREFFTEAGIDPDFETLDQIGARIALRDVLEKAIVDIPLRGPADATRRALEMLLRLLPRTALTKILTTMFEHRFVAERWCREYGEAPAAEIAEAWRRYESAALGESSKDAPVQDEIAAEAMKALAVVYHEVRSLYEEEKGAGLRLDFDDLLERTLRMIEEHPAVARELAGRFRHILIDEFHDTDAQQWAILRRILAQRGGVAAGGLFIVGDPKQSIYGFRNADVRVFSRVRDEIIESCTTSKHRGDLRMNTNYRSRPAIIAFVNHLFQRMMTRESEALEYEISYEKLELPSDYDRSRPGAVELLFLQAAPDDSDRVEHEAEAVARRIARIVRHGGDSPRSFGDVAILLRRKTHLKTYEAALRNYDIPYMTLGGLGFYERQELYDVRNVLRFLFNEMDDLALLGALRSEICGLSDELLYKISAHPGRSLWEKLLKAGEAEGSTFAPSEREIVARAVSALEESRADSRHALPSDFLRRLVERTGYWTALAAGAEGRQRTANIEKLITIAQRFEASGFVSLVDFLDQLDLSIEGEEREGEAQTELDALNAVKIMTIHAAKGLEFPVVIVPDLAGQINYGSKAAIWIEPDYGLALKIADPDNDFAAAPTRLRSMLTNYTRAKIRAEEKRLLYVAATRAREHLVLCASPGKRARAADTAFHWLCKALEIADADYERGFVEFAEDVYPGEQQPATFRIPIIRRAAEIALPDAERAEVGSAEEDRSGAPPLLARLDEIVFQRKSDRAAPLILTQPLLAQPAAEVIAVTDVQSAAQCPARYFFDRFLGAAPEDIAPSARAVLRPPAPERDLRAFAMLRGSLIHQALEELHTPAAGDRRRFPQSLVDAGAHGLTHDQRAALVSDIVRTLERFEKSDLAARLAHARPVLRELPLRLQLNGGFLSGKIDCLFRDADGHWRVIDFKTDSIARKAVESHARNYEVQIRAYALFARSLAAPGEPVSTGLYFTELDYLHSASFGREELTAIQRDLESLFKRVAAYREEIGRFGERPFRECLERMLAWCDACGERGALRCAHDVIRTLREQMK